MPPVPVPSRHPIASQAPKPSKHFSWRSQARPLIVVVALLIANAGLDIAKAGFFDELLGAGEPMERNYQQGPRWPRAAQWAEARGLRHRFAHSERMRERRLSYPPKQDSELPGRGRFNLAGFCYIVRPLGDDVGHVDALLHDATLQPGDSVMTAKGVRVFKGGGGCPHKNTDFLALAEIPGLPKRERRALAAIDKLIKTPRVAVLVGGFAAVAARARPARASHE